MIRLNSVFKYISRTFEVSVSTNISALCGSFSSRFVKFFFYNFRITGQNKYTHVYSFCFRQTPHVLLSPPIICLTPKSGRVQFEWSRSCNSFSNTAVSDVNVELISSISCITVIMKLHSHFNILNSSKIIGNSKAKKFLNSKTKNLAKKIMKKHIYIVHIMKFEVLSYQKM